MTKALSFLSSMVGVSLICSCVTRSPEADLSPPSARGVASSTALRTRIKEDCSTYLTSQTFSSSADVVAAANIILKQAVPDINLILNRFGPGDFEIRDTGNPGRRIAIHARIKFLPRSKVADRDYYAFRSADEAGPDPIRTLYIEEIRLNTYSTAVGSDEPLKGLGVGNTLMATVAKIARLNEIYAISGKLDEDNKAVLWADYQTSRNVIHAVEAAPTRRALKSLGYQVDLDHSSILLDRDKDASRFMVTQVIAP